MAESSKSEIDARLRLSGLGEDTERSPRAREILDAGRELLANEGYSNFSLRRVASDVGVHLRTVQHYFKTKDSLMREVLWDTVIYYKKIFEERVNKPGLEPVQRFRLFLEYLMSGFRERSTAGFFLQLWAHAHHNEDAALILDRMHNVHVSEISRYMDAMDVDISDKKRKQRAAMIVAMVEGIALVVSYRKSGVADLNDIGEEVYAMAHKIATEA